jgi:hypothetical protein
VGITKEAKKKKNRALRKEKKIKKKRNGRKLILFLASCKNTELETNRCRLTELEIVSKLDDR